MTANSARKILCVQISRGLAPAVTVANTVAAAMMNEMPYKLIAGRTAVDAKQEAALAAIEQGADLLLVEDDVMPDRGAWDAVIENKTDVMVATAIMRNGMLNTWFHGDRVLYSGTVFLKIPLPVLERIGDPWFACHDLEFNANRGEWRDKGPNADGQSSDVWFFRRCWELGIPVLVAGFAVHYLHQGNALGSDLKTPSDVRPMGMTDCTKVTMKKKEGENHE